MFNKGVEFVNNYRCSKVLIFECVTDVKSFSIIPNSKIV